MKEHIFLPKILGKWQVEGKHMNGPLFLFIPVRGDPSPNVVSQLEYRYWLERADPLMNINTEKR